MNDLKKPVMMTLRQVMGERTRLKNQMDALLMAIGLEESENVKKEYFLTLLPIVDGFNSFESMLAHYLVTTDSKWAGKRVSMFLTLLTATNLSRIRETGMSTEIINEEFPKIQAIVDEFLDETIIDIANFALY